MRVWRHRVNIKPSIKDEDSAQKCAEEVLKKIAPLMKKAVFKSDSDLYDIVESFKELSGNGKAADDEFNDVLERFYAWADDNDVWCGL